MRTLSRRYRFMVPITSCHYSAGFSAVGGFVQIPREGDWTRIYRQFLLCYFV